MKVGNQKQDGQRRFVLFKQIVSSIRYTTSLLRLKNHRTLSFAKEPIPNLGNVKSTRQGTDSEVQGPITLSTVELTKYNNTVFISSETSQSTSVNLRYRVFTVCSIPECFLIGPNQHTEVS